MSNSSRTAVAVAETGLQAATAPSQATDGWKPLCEFLGVEAPVDEPYPHLNYTETLQRNFATMMETNELISPYEPK